MSCTEKAMSYFIVRFALVNLIKEMEAQKINMFSYSDILFSCFVNDQAICSHKASSHFLIYVYSGKMSVIEDGKKIVAKAGECLFVKRDHQVYIDKEPYKGEEYKDITMVFNRDFLRNYYKLLDKKTIPNAVAALSSLAFKLPKSVDVDSLFLSLVPYFDSEDAPNSKVMELKVQEGLITLLHMDERFYPTLFDFTEPWKIDILEFLNENYMCDLSLEEIALYTGRSLAAFKRDFSQLSELSPRKWIMEKRLNVSYNKILGGKKEIADICFHVGFKNRSHFTTAFKRQFGITPSELQMATIS